MCHFRAQNGPFVMNYIFLVQTIIVTFIYLLALFIVQNLQKFLLHSCRGSRVMRMHHFWAQNGPSAPNNFFFGKLLTSLSPSYYPLSLDKILKKFFLRIQGYKDVQFLGPKLPISPNDNFFQKTCY